MEKGEYLIISNSMGSSSSVSKNKDNNISVIQSVSTIDLSSTAQSQSQNFVKLSSIPVTESYSKVDDQKVPALIGNTNTDTISTDSTISEREKAKSESNQNQNKNDSIISTFNGLHIVGNTTSSSKNTFEVIPANKSVSVIEVEVVGDTTTTKIGQGGTKSDRTDRPNSSEKTDRDQDEGIEKVLAEIEANFDFKSGSNKHRNSVSLDAYSTSTSNSSTGPCPGGVSTSKNDTLNVTSGNVSIGSRHLSTMSSLQSDQRNLNNENEGYDYSSANSFQNQLYQSERERSNNFQINSNSKTPPDRGLKSQGGGHQHTHHAVGANMIIPPNRVRSEQSTNRNIGLHTSYPIKSRPKPSQVLFFQQQLHQQQEDQRRPRIPGAGGGSGGPLYSYNSKFIKKKNESSDLLHDKWKYEPPKIDGFDINKFKEVNQKQTIKLDRSMPNLSVYNNNDDIEDNKDREMHSRSVNASPLPSYTEDELDLLLSIEKEIGN